MNKVYRVVFTGLLRTEEYFKDRISLLGVSHATADEILKKAPVILKEAESLDYIKKYAHAITEAGGNVNVYSCNSADNMETGLRTIPGMSSFTQCPQCGYRQPKNELCVRCGHILISLVKG